MKQMYGWILGSLLIANAGYAAQQLQDEKYFSIGSATLTENRADPYGDNIEYREALSWNESATTIANAAAEMQGDPSLGSIIKGALGDAPDLAPWNVLLDQVINMGKKVWNIVESNKPVVDLKIDMANAVPTGISSWMDLGTWGIPRGKVYTMSYKNLYGIEVVKFEYRVLFTPGGSYQGVGRYLANVTIVPGEISVAWGYKFSAENNVANTLNVGTKQNPVGGMQLNMTWNVSTPLKTIQSSGTYFVQGDGQFVDLTNGNGLL